MISNPGRDEENFDMVSCTNGETNKIQFGLPIGPIPEEKKKEETIHDEKKEFIIIPQPKTNSEASQGKKEEIEEKITEPDTKNQELFNQTENKLRPLKITEEEIEGFLEVYLRKISPEIKESYPMMAEILKRTHNSPEPYFMIYSSDLTKNAFDLLKEGIEGLTIFCRESNPNNKRITILHASSIGNLKVSKFIELIIEYIWKTVNCSEIRVELTYLRQGENFEPFSELKKAFCEDNKFKWKTLLNDSTKESGKRVVAFGLSKPSNLQYIDNTSSYNITFKQAVILSFSSKYAKDTIPIIQPNWIASCSLLQALNLIQQSSEEEDTKVHTLVKMNSILRSKVYNNRINEILGWA